MTMATMRITTSTLLLLLQIPYSLAISLLQFLTSLPPLFPSKPNRVITSPKKAYPEWNFRLLIADLPRYERPFRRITEWGEGTGRACLISNTGHSRPWRTSIGYRSGRCAVDVDEECLVDGKPRQAVRLYSR